MSAEILIFVRIIHGASGSEGAKSGGTVVLMESASKHGSVSIEGNRRLIDAVCDSHWAREIEGPTTIAGRPGNQEPRGTFAGTIMINHHIISGISLTVGLEPFICQFSPNPDSIKICVLVRKSREELSRDRLR
jgi:hypothetical protein